MMTGRAAFQRMTTWLITVAVALLAGSCGIVPSGKGYMNTITKEQASQRVDDYLAQMVAVLLPPPRLELASAISGLCKDPDDNGPQGRVDVGRTYWLRDIPRDRNRAFFDTLRRYWADRGYRVLGDQSGPSPFVSVENPQDGFRMGIQESSQGDLSLGASSPCVWPNGTPAPPP